MFNFGNNRRNNYGNSNNNLCQPESNSPLKSICSCFLPFAVVVGIFIISFSIKKLGSTIYGVQYDVYAKQLDDAAKLGGLHLGPPGYRFIKFPSTQISLDLTDTCVSRDGLRVQFAVTFQYLMPEDQIVNAIVNYRDYKKWSQVVNAAGNSAVQHSCSEFNVTNFQNKRNLIQDAMFHNLKLKLQGSVNGTFTDAGVYARAVSLQLKNVELPEEYNTAVAEKQSAEEDITLAKNQRLQETTKATTEFKAAEEEATKIMDRARNEANVTLTKAKLSAQQTLFSFARETEVLVQAKEGFGLDNHGILAYMANQLYSKVGSLSVTQGEPAKLSRKDEL